MKKFLSAFFICLNLISVPNFQSLAIDKKGVEKTAIVTVEGTQSNKKCKENSVKDEKKADKITENEKILVLKDENSSKKTIIETDVKKFNISLEDGKTLNVDVNAGIAVSVDESKNTKNSNEYAKNSSHITNNNKTQISEKKSRIRSALIVFGKDVLFKTVSAILTYLPQYLIRKLI